MASDLSTGTGSGARLSPLEWDHLVAADGDR